MCFCAPTNTPVLSGILLSQLAGCDRAQKSSSYSSIYRHRQNEIPYTPGENMLFYMMYVFSRCLHTRLLISD